MSALLKSHKGFTLIELMISLAAASIVTAGIYGFYNAQQKSHVTQQLVVELQQNLRATMSLMKREIRMAGYDPCAVDGFDNDGIGGVDDNGESVFSLIPTGAFTTAAGDMVAFSWDMDYSCVIEATGSGEQIAYSFAAGEDTDFDGIADNGSAPLTRALGGPTVPASMADDIEAVAFAYAFDNDLDGDLDVGNINGNVIWAYDSLDGVNDGNLDTILDTNDDGLINAGDTPGGAALATVFASATVPNDRIRAVRIWLLGRTRSPIRGHQENRIYVVGDRRVNPAGDSFQRRLLVETVSCRNM